MSLAPDRALVHKVRWRTVGAVSKTYRGGAQAFLSWYGKQVVA